jgi:hypothetical protein
VEALVEQDEVAPVRVLLELAGVAVDRRPALLVPQEDAVMALTPILRLVSPWIRAWFSRASVPGASDERRAGAQAYTRDRIEWPESPASGGIVTATYGLRSRVLLVTLMAAVACAGVSCAARGDVAGRYVSDQDSRDSIELEADGAFTIQEDGGTVNGTYTVSGSELHLEASSGQMLTARIEDGVLTDGGIGKRWTKQQGPGGPAR